MQATRKPQARRETRQGCNTREQATHEELFELKGRRSGREQILKGRTKMLRAASFSKSSLYVTCGAAPTNAPPTNMTTASGGPASLGGPSTQQSSTFCQSDLPSGPFLFALRMIRPSTFWNASGVSLGWSPALEGLFVGPRCAGSERRTT